MTLNLWNCAQHIIACRAGISVALIVNGKKIVVDKEGFLKNLNDWTPKIAEHLAVNEGIKLTDQHWEAITAARDFYHDFELSPEMRPFIKYISNKLGKDKGSSIYLLTLFPNSPAKLISKIAGLPKPDNCL